MVSPPYAANLNSLLSGHIGQDGLGADADTSMITADLEAINNNTASLKKKKTKKLKEKSALDKPSSSKCDNNASALKQGRFATAAAPAATPPVSSKVFNHEQV
jgi:hypothetical protein